MQEYIEFMDCEILADVKSKYVPDDAVKKECVELVRIVADKVNAI